jgi:hypothetical protein
MEFSDMSEFKEGGRASICGYIIGYQMSFSVVLLLDIAEEGFGHI